MEPLPGRLRAPTPQERRAAARHAIYLLQRDDPPGALWLARAVHRADPADDETAGLLAVLLLRRARHDPDGGARLVAEAAAVLDAVPACRPVGPFRGHAEEARAAWARPVAAGGGQTGRMRQAYAHDAVLVLAPGADERAPGAAVTEALCGALDHPPPCPLAPHHAATRVAGPGRLGLHVIFATEPEREATVRSRIDAALAAGTFTGGPDGATSRWELVTSVRGAVAGADTARADRLLRAP